MNNIPSDEDFARAHKLDDEKYKNLRDIEEIVFKHFKDICPLYIIYILHQGNLDFEAYIFFKNNKDIYETRKIGIQQSIIDFIYEELVSKGYGKREDIRIVFEFDSDENVKKNFDGDYYFRLT